MVFVFRCQDGFPNPTKIVSSWTKLAQVGPKLAQLGLKLAQVGVSDASLDYKFTRSGSHSLLECNLAKHSANMAANLSKMEAQEREVFSGFSSFFRS